MATFSNKHNFWLILVCFTFSANCSGDNLGSEAEKWSLKEEDSKNVEFGVYKATLIIEEDGCDPSLSEIVDNTENWPPALVGVHGNRVGTNAYIGSAAYILRTGELLSFYAPTNSNGYVIKNQDREDLSKRPSFTYTECILKAFKDNQLQGTLEYIVEDDSTIVLRVDWEWGDVTSCVGDDWLRDWAWMPKDACRESYELRYELIEPCSETVSGLDNYTHDNAIFVEGIDISYLQPDVGLVAKQCKIDNPEQYNEPNVRF